MKTMTDTVTLDKATYRIAHIGAHSMELVGPRGGSSTMQQNVNRPEMWAHLTMSGYRAKTVWYRKTDAGFEVTSW